MNFNPQNLFIGLMDFFSVTAWPLQYSPQQITHAKIKT
jgi:hypothetical protein